MNNFKKIGLTALGTSLIATSAFAGSLDVSGGASITLSGKDKGTAANGFSMSDSITFSGGGEMDNGWNVTVSYELDDNETATGNMDSRSVKIDTNGMGVITFAGHGGSSAMGAVDDVMPTAYGESFDIIGGTSDVGKTGTEIYNAIGSAGSNNMFHYSSGDLVDGFKLTASYVPSGTGEVESSTDLAVEYTGMEGLTVGIAQGENNAAGGTGNTDNSTMYVKYAYGPVTVGYQESEIDAEAATADDDYEAMGITYQVSDDLTIGYTESTYNAGSETTDQENSNLSASYTMGGMTLSIAMAEEKNRGGSTAASDDVKGYNINLAFAF
ncbi:porin [Candidatus Pelagibacter sp.]|uniref:porin n=1 Tax=Candidatus Pelagibacter sp. TaxID=2024849 RepID=UPI003F84FC77